MSKSRRHYTKEFKAQAVELARSGRSIRELAAELEVGSDLIYTWLRNAKAAQGGSKADRAGGEEDAAAELRRLRAENARLKMENDILKKAAVIIGSTPRSKGAK